MTRRGGYDELGRAARAVHASAESLGARIPGSAFVTTVFGEVQQLEYELEGAPEGALDDLDRNLLGLRLTHSRTWREHFGRCHCYLVSLT